MAGNNAQEAMDEDLDSQSKNLVIPPLSDALRTLLALSDTDRLNIRVLELICLKDPGAVARIIAYATNAAQMGASNAKNSGKSRTLAESLTLIGSAAACDLLLGMWGVETLPVPAKLLAARNALAKHIFMMLTTARRIVLHAGVADQVPTDELMLLVLVDRLSLAMALMSQSDEALQEAVAKAITEGHHAFHRIPEVAAAFHVSRSITRAWKLSTHLDGYLATLDHWQAFERSLVPTVSVVLCAEAVLEAAFNPEAESLVREELPKVDSVARALVTRGVDPVGLAVKY